MPIDKATGLLYIRIMNDKYCQAIAKLRDSYQTDEKTAKATIARLQEVAQQQYGITAEELILGHTNSQVADGGVADTTPLSHQVPEHDCHASAEDGCQFCMDWYERQGVSSK